MLKLMMLVQVNCMLAGQILIVRDDEFNEKCTCTFYSIVVPIQHSDHNIIFKYIVRITK